VRVGVDLAKLRRADRTGAVEAFGLVVVSKSPWLPAIRREHALSTQAVSRGLDVAFVEQPADIRALADRRSRRSWLTNMTGPARRPSTGSPWVMQRSTILPGHYGSVGLALDTRMLSQRLGRLLLEPETTVVASAPWYWPAVASCRAGRKVVDLADDWAELLPGRAALCRELYRRIADEADAIVVAAPALQELFPGRHVEVVRNATDDELVARPMTPRPRGRVLTAVGTLSERFDDELAGALLDRLPGWELRLYGEMRYAGGGATPSGGLRRLMDRPDGRAGWHGVLARSALADVIDAADVLLVVHRSPYTAGQDSMKLYDYAARGRPVVCTSGGLPAIRPPHLYVGETAEQLAASAEAARQERDGRASDRHAWAATNSWSARWPAWWAAVSGRA
jgi:hypothetical protein